MKTLFMTFLTMVLAGCTTPKTPEVRTPAQEIPNTPLGEPLQKAMGAVTSADIEYVQKLCFTVDAAQGDASRTCLKTLNELLKSKFDRTAPSPSRLDLSVLTCELVPRQEGHLQTYYFVRFHCLKNAFNLSEATRALTTESHTQCGVRAVNDLETVRRQGDCYKRALQSGLIEQNANLPLK